MDGSLLLGMNPADPGVWRWPVTAVYVALLVTIAVYGVHRYWLVWLFRRHRRDRPRPAGRFAALPRVTVQLPMFNEAAVAQRVIDAACALDYPRRRLQVQVLDDSTDHCAEIARRRVEVWRQRGVDVVHVRRANRAGFKAGALQEGMQTATGELIAIFDADFVPPPRFLRRCVRHFTDRSVGLVQARWSHLNREESLLTRGQAIFLDGHFVIEHTARHRAGAWINFNGTAGVWRRSAIDAAGGWQADTLTEDLDLSYRAQLAGWRSVYLPHVTCPAELPPEIRAFRSQQHRWTKGAIQVAMKLLPRVLRSPHGARVKVEALFHLTSPLVYLWVTLLALLFYPAMHLNLRGWGGGDGGGVSVVSLAVGALMLALGTCSAACFYVASQSALGRPWWRTALQIPMLMALGVGIALSNAAACVEGLMGRQSPFVRTPKYGCGPRARRQATTPGPGRESTPGRGTPWLAVLEIAMGCYMLLCIRLALTLDYAAAVVPLLALFAAGYFHVGVALWRTAGRGEGSAGGEPGSAPASPGAVVPVST